MDRLDYLLTCKKEDRSVRWVRELYRYLSWVDAYYSTIDFYQLNRDLQDDVLNIRNLSVEYLSDCLTLEIKEEQL